MNNLKSILFEVKDIHTVFNVTSGDVYAVRGVSFSINEGETMGIIGESGCGKSATAMSICNMLPKNGFVTNGEVIFEGENLLTKSSKKLKMIKGNSISVIFQDSLSSLNPIMTIGNQIAEVVRYNKRISWKKSKEHALQMLQFVGFPNPLKYMKSYPHELSGGMRQRILIAMALVCQPKLLIADEPTTALDVTTQSQILILMKSLQQKLGTSILMISHDLGVIAEFCQSLLVMYGGLIVESGDTKSLLNKPLHPYTSGLISIVEDMNKDVTDYLYSIEGRPPELSNPPKGCPFASRCKYTMIICRDNLPNFYGYGKHKVRCWLYDENCPQKRGY